MSPFTTLPLARPDLISDSVPPPLPEQPPVGHPTPMVLLHAQLTAQRGPVADLRTISADALRDVSDDELSIFSIAPHTTHLLLPPRCPVRVIDHLLSRMPHLEALSAPDQRPDDRVLDLRPAHRLRLFHTTFGSALPFTGDVPMLLTSLADLPEPVPPTTSTHRAHAAEGGRVRRADRDPHRDIDPSWPLSLLQQVGHPGCRIVLPHDADIELLDARLRAMMDRVVAAVQAHRKSPALRGVAPAVARWSNNDMHHLRRSLLVVPHELLPPQAADFVQGWLRKLDHALEHLRVDLGRGALPEIRDMLKLQRKRASELMAVQPWREQPVTLLESLLASQVEEDEPPEPAPRTVFFTRTADGQLIPRATESEPVRRHARLDEVDQSGTSAQSRWKSV